MNALHRNDDGTLPAFAWPGGYPLLYYTADGGALCPACANGGNRSEASESPDTPAGWRLTGGGVYWEGVGVPCDHCGAMQESAYGGGDENGA